jgi:hypothetical protein
MHTWFNPVFWHQFGRNPLEIEYNLARDHFSVLRAILHDVPETPLVKATLDRWERSGRRSYLYRHPYGFYDLARQVGVRAAAARVSRDFPLRQGGPAEWALAAVGVPATRARYWLGRWARRLPQPVVRALLRLTGRPT